MGYNIGFFKKTDTGFAGNIETLALKIPTEFTRVLNRTNDKAPGFEIFTGELRIGAAWERQGRSGKYCSVSFDDPTFSAGFYNLYATRGTQDRFELVFERPRSKAEEAPQAS